MSWSSALVSNQTTQRASTLCMDTDWEGMGENVTEEMFDVEQLRDYR